MARRRDVSGITIDDPWSLEIDDAINGYYAGGRYIIEISITDVASSLPMYDALDRDAYIKGFTRYFRNGRNPMIPGDYSEKYLSVFPRQPRNAITLRLVMDRFGRIEYSRLMPTQITSIARLTHESASMIASDLRHPLHSILRICGIATDVLRERRIRRIGMMRSRSRRRHTRVFEQEFFPISDDSHCHPRGIIEELMLHIGEYAGCMLDKYGIPALFRNHHRIGRKKQMRNDRMPMIIVPRPGARYNQSDGRWGRGFYSTRAIGHDGMRMHAYIHCTSAIRRYVDVVNQRILLAVLFRKRSPYSRMELGYIAEHINAIEREIRRSHRIHTGCESMNHIEEGRERARYA